MVLPYKRTAPLRIGAVPQMLGHGTVYPSPIILSHTFLGIEEIVRKYKDICLKCLRSGGDRKHIWILLAVCL